MAQATRNIQLPEFCLFTKAEYNKLVARRSERGFSVKQWFKRDFVDATFRK